MGRSSCAGVPLYESKPHAPRRGPQHSTNGDLRARLPLPRSTQPRSRGNVTDHIIRDDSQTDRVFPAPAWPVAPMHQRRKACGDPAANWHLRTSSRFGNHVRSLSPGLQDRSGRLPIAARTAISGLRTPTPEAVCLTILAVVPLIPAGTLRVPLGSRRASRHSYPVSPEPQRAALPAADSDGVDIFRPAVVRWPCLLRSVVPQNYCATYGWVHRLVRSRPAPARSRVRSTPRKPVGETDAANGTFTREGLGAQNNSRLRRRPRAHSPFNHRSSNFVLLAPPAPLSCATVQAVGAMPPASYRAATKSVPSTAHLYTLPPSTTTMAPPARESPDQPPQSIPTPTRKRLTNLGPLHAIRTINSTSSPTPAQRCHRQHPTNSPHPGPLPGPTIPLFCPQTRLTTPLGHRHTADQQVVNQ